MNQAQDFCLVGTGAVFDSIAGDPAGYGLPEGWTLRRADDLASLAASVGALLEGLEPGGGRLFVAVDQNALNHARLELYGAARLRGLKLATLVHARAIVAPDATLADNVWIGAGALVDSAARIAGDVLVNPGARIDARVRIGMHGWIGPGASVGAGTEIGAHCVVGADARLGAGLKVGKFCVIERPGPHDEDLPAGSFMAAQFATPARMIGAGYSFEKQR
jgi:carbonic anhydrase/acetyltransferase-like protein (isoleucine patch superfamily)